jgi:hypothetical protein
MAILPVLVSAVPREASGRLSCFAGIAGDWSARQGFIQGLGGELEGQDSAGTAGGPGFQGRSEAKRR